jgi:hypothetical protein
MTGFATRATLFPNLFLKFEKGLVMPPYRKVLGKRVAPVAKSLAVSRHCERMGAGVKCCGHPVEKPPQIKTLHKRLFFRFWLFGVGWAWRT